MRRNWEQDAKLSPDNSTALIMHSPGDRGKAGTATLSRGDFKPSPKLQVPHPWVPLWHPALPAHHHQALCLQGAPSIK